MPKAIAGALDPVAVIAMEGHRKGNGIGLPIQAFAITKVEDGRPSVTLEVRQITSGCAAGRNR